MSTPLFFLVKGLFQIGFGTESNFVLHKLCTFKSILFTFLKYRQGNSFIVSFYREYSVAQNNSYFFIFLNEEIL